MNFIKRFRTVNGVYVNIIDHVLESLKKNTNVQVHVGTDSQNISQETIYVTVIAFRYDNNGVHYILHKQKIPRINDIWTRLWKETEMTIEVAEWLKAQLPYLKITIDMDFNDDVFWKSNQLISASKGWAQSLGYKVNTKPAPQIATKAADYNCR